MLLVAIPLAIEKKLLLRQLENDAFQCQIQNTGLTQVMLFTNHNLIIAQIGHGKAQAALVMRHILDSFPSIRAVIGFGSAGALSPGLAIGDLVVGLQTIEHDFHSLFHKMHRPSFSASPLLVNQLKQIQYMLPDFLKFGFIASGDEDIINPSRKQQIFFQTQALCVAWEGAGMARACQFSATPFIEIRGISDLSDKDSLPDFKKNLRLICVNFARLLSAWIHDRNKK